MATDQLGVALIGSGLFAQEEHLPALLSNPSLKLVAIYSRSLASAKSLSKDLKDVDLYSEDSGEGKGYADLLKRADLKGVIVCLPIPNQPAFIKQALSAGKHVLSEKPVAPTLAAGKELIDWYRSSIPASTIWAVAENFRYLDTFRYGAEQISQLGRVLGLRVRLGQMVKPGGKWYETAWRKTPDYQGGFLLDGGVHYIAGTRVLLGTANAIVRTSAHSQQLQEHLPPVDTVDATVKLASGATGTVSISFGTTFKSNEYSVACENGIVSVLRGKVVVTKDEADEVKEFPDEGSGVAPESKAWGESLVSGKPDTRQIPEEALADLELLEAFLRSGEQNGAPIELKYSV
ncbi:NAD(P)-binding protein [Mytilinidion resinicola]|uniref:NAD(P)-binding protein n=1 Tax=Mytilinidion resinicola TaxID=574789 RepID=A0A6A6YCT6_9PEZI|nr:NAD(P)-binding protein [Mytilinidion resinicola]KAF2806409.1 NAD(P)-binding protein [Mytilinidion resinicola]